MSEESRAAGQTHSEYFSTTQPQTSSHGLIRAVETTPVFVGVYVRLCWLISAWSCTVCDRQHRTLWDKNEAAPGQMDWTIGSFRSAKYQSIEYLIGPDTRHVTVFKTGQLIHSFWVSFLSLAQFYYSSHLIWNWEVSQTVWDWNTVLGERERERVDWMKKTDWKRDSLINERMD